MNLNTWLSKENREFAAFLQNLAGWVEPQMKQGIHPGYTDHTIGHSKRVVDYMSKLVEPCMSSSSPLAEQEVCLLIAAAYLHDIGMQDQRNEKLEEIRDKHNILSGNLIREIGDQIASQTLSINPSPFPGFFGMTALIAEGHRKVDLSDSKYDDCHVSGQRIRLRLLTALLLLADELDADYCRAPLPMLELSNYPPTTQLHWYKSYYISAVLIEEGVITLHYQFPPDKGREYQRIFDRIVGDKIKEAVEKVNPFLQEYGIDVQMGGPKMREWADIKDLSHSVKLAAIDEARKSAMDNREYKKVDEDIKYYDEMSSDLAKTS